MKDPSRTLARGILHSLTGLCVQLVVGGLLLWITFAYPEDVSRHVFWTCLAGILVWLHLIVTYSLLKREAHCEGSAGGGGGEISQDAEAAVLGGRIRAVHRGYQRFGLALMELGVAALLFQSTRLGLSGIAAEAALVTRNSLFLVAAYSVITLGLVVFSVYLTSLMQMRSWRLLRSGRNYTALMSAAFFCLLAGASFEHFRILLLTRAVGWGLIVVNTALAAEALFSVAVRFFAPRRAGELPRPAFDFYLLQALSQPMRIGQTFAAMLEGIFGFDITQTSLGKVVRSLILPGLLLSGVVLFGLSSLLMVQPYEQAVLLSLGRLRERPLGPGLHVKLPWPLSSVRRHDVARLRSVHVGSHKPARPGGDVYREGVPILWTNMHGLNVDELLICSPPQDLVEPTGRGDREKQDGRKAPSISLAAADVRVQFVIEDLISYVRSSAAPEALLRNAAETYASMLIYRHDIDSLFCEGRLALAGELRRSIQHACNEMKLGIRVVHVAITAAHPPVDVAGDFEETVAAMQERETKIQQAEQQSIRMQVEATGSTEAFRQLAAYADRAESGDGVGVPDVDRLLHACGGEVSRILREAEAYRFSRENIQRGKIERFDGQLGAHSASPVVYRYDRYFSVLERGLADRRKIMLLGNADKRLIRIGLQEDTGSFSLPEEIGFRPDE